jgi:hypothetical protein
MRPDHIDDATLRLLENLRREINHALSSPGIMAAITDLDNAGYSLDFALDIRLYGSDPREVERIIETLPTSDEGLIFTTRHS